MQDVSMQDVDHLVLKVLSLQDIRKNLHQVQEELNWERQNYESETRTHMHWINAHLSSAVPECLLQASIHHSLVSFSALFESFYLFQLFSSVI